jgi:hypothetical protein
MIVVPDGGPVKWTAGKMKDRKLIGRYCLKGIGCLSGASIGACANVSSALTPFAVGKSLFGRTTGDYFLLVSSNLPLFPEMDSLMSVSD